MSAYRVSLDEFMELYGDHPEYKHMWKTERKSMKANKNGNNEDVNEAIQKMTRSQRYIRRLSFWKYNSLKRSSKSSNDSHDTEVICNGQEVADGHQQQDCDDDTVKRTNAMKKNEQLQKQNKVNN